MNMQVSLTGDSINIVIEKFVNKMAFFMCIFLHGVFKLEFTVHADQEICQDNCFTPVCLRMCLLKLELSENSDPHT